MGKIRVVVTASALILAAVLAAPANAQDAAAGAFDRKPYIEKDFVLFWPNPVRAHPGVPLDFRFVAYEADNQKLTWALKDAPKGMAIDASGRVAWTPADADLGAHKMSVRVTRKSGESIERPFTLTVSRDDFLFVSPKGSDDATGTIDAPFATIEHALRLLNSGDGKTIYLRGGTYSEHYDWERRGTPGPWRGKRFSPEDPVEVRSYPGEWAVLDCKDNGHGLSTGDHCIIDNMEVKNAGARERGGLWIGSDHVMIRDVVVHDSHWTLRANCTGYLIHGRDVVLDHTVGYDNRDPNSNHWNSSNYLVYTSGRAGNVYILNSTSWGSIVGFKIKHAGPGKLILHNCRSIDESIGFGAASAWSSARYCVFLKGGIELGITDPSAWTPGPMLIEHNTIVNARQAILVLGNYLRKGVELRNNLIYNDVAAARRDERRPNWLLAVSIYNRSGQFPRITAVDNLFYGLSPNDIVRWGRGYESFDEWSKTPGNTGNVFAKPGFKDLKQGDLTLPADSPVRLADGSFAGAFVPGEDYAPVKTGAMTNAETGMTNH